MDEPNTKRRKTRLIYTLFARLTLAVAAVALCLWAANYLLSTQITNQLALRGISGKARLVATFMGAELTGAVRFKDGGAIQARSEQAMAASDGDVVSITVMAADGTVLFEGGQGLPQLQALASDALARGEDVTGAGGLIQASPIRLPDGNAIGAVAVRADTANSMVAVSHGQQRIMAVSLVILAASLAAFAVLLRWLLIRPLDDVRVAMRRLSNKEFDIELRVAERQDEIGAMAGDVMVFRDKLKENDHQARQILYQSAAFSGTSAAMLMTNQDGTIIAANRQWSKLFGEHREVFESVWPDIAKTDFVGRSIDVFHARPEHQRALHAHKEKMPRQSDIMIGELIMELNVQMIEDEQGNYAGNILEWRHVTGERESEGVIRAMKASQGIMTYKADGNIVAVNDNVVGWYGRTRAELEGGERSLFADAEDGTMEGLWAAVVEGQLAQGRVLRRATDGRRVWLDVTLAPIKDSKGKVFRVVEIANDVTEVQNARIEAEALRQKNEAAQSRAVHELGDALAALAKGDLTFALHDPFDPEYDRLRADFNLAVDGLRAAIADIVEVSVNILGGANEIARASDDLSRRTENQAATLEQTAAALDEITSSVKSTADDAEGADSAVSTARDSAGSGGAVVLEAVDAMREIETSSEQISKIITVIDDIAFQTNLLALNAGVEAARAGDAGRGFAVVASEVRALAQRSSDAAKQIKGLISTSAQHVKNGVALVGKSGDALTHIVESVENISSLIASIAGASREQSTGLTEINSGVVQLDDVTQQNAAMVQEATAASHAMRAEAERLGGLVASFSVGEARAELDTAAPETGAAGGEAAAPAKAAVDVAPRTAAGSSGWEEF